MSFLYPRTITISRQDLATGGGVQGYGGASASKEQVLFADVPASIQQKSISAKPDARLPADAVSRTMWRVLIPRSAGIANGHVLRNDIVTDEAGQRYQVVAPYINSLGPNFLCERLEA